MKWIRCPGEGRILWKEQVGTLGLDLTKNESNLAETTISLLSSQTAVRGRPPLWPHSFRFRIRSTVGHRMVSSDLRYPEAL